MIARFHYDRQALTQFLGEAPPEDDSDIAIHLEQCQECQAKLESLFDEGLTMETAGELLRDRAADEQTREQVGSDSLTELDRSTFLELSEYPGSLGRFARFEIMELLGRGGMGIVMRGFDTSLNRHSAIKVLAPELASSAAARKRFSREAKSAAAVVHPHVVPIQTVDEHDGLPYLVMPVVEGQSVDARVRNAGPVQVIEAVRIASQIAEGLAAAHEQGLVHRDIKPANVLLENGVERVQITDFGLARAVDDASMTRSGVIAGTPQYMSPEQAHGDSIDHRSDLFSLGSLIYFMLTGHSPFRAETTMGVLNRIGNEQPRGLRSINADIPEWFEQIVMKLLAKPREDRFQTAAEVAELLQRWHAHLQQPDIVDPPEKVNRESASRLARSRGGIAKWLIATAAFGFLAFAGIMIVLELDKGTLTIESEANDVPIRIMQGDEMVKRLTVTKSGTSVKVASGKYVVLLDGEFSDIHVEQGTVTLGRRDTKNVRVVQSEDRDTVQPANRNAFSPANAGPFRRNKLAPANDRPAPFIPFIFYGPEGLKVQLAPIDKTDNDQWVSNGPCPCPFKVVSSMVHAVRVSNLPGKPDDSITCKLDVRKVEEELFSRLHQLKHIRVNFTNADFDHVASGYAITKTIYIPAERLGKKPEFRTLVSSVLGDDVVAKAGLGKVIAILRMLPKTAKLKQESTTEKTVGTERFNTPTILGALRGRWQEVDHSEGEDFNQTLVFNGQAMGQWFRTAGTHPVTITYYIEGTELLLQFNYEPVKAFDYRMKQLRFAYKLEGDSLSLTRDGVTTHFKRIREPSPAKTPTQSQINSVQAPDLESTLNSEQSAGGKSPTPVNTLADSVRHFNHTIQAADLDAPPQPPLTVEELRCLAQWKLRDKQLSVETKGVLRDIGIGGWLPNTWKIQGRESKISIDDDEIGVYFIELKSRYSDAKIVVRRRFLSVSANYHAPRRPDPIETATPLKAAIDEFNATRNEVDGLPQPPLTLQEVLAAILDWKSRRNEAPVDNKTFANLQEIAMTHQLPAGTKFELIPSFETSAGDTFKIWSVRVLMPQVAKPGWTYAFTIREQYLTVNSALKSAIHWGKPNDDGLQAGFRLIPAQREYQPGQSIQPEFLYRSVSGKAISATIPNAFSYLKMIARDAKGKALDVVQLGKETVIGGAIGTEIGETPTRMRGKPLELGFITPDLEFDSISPNATYLTVDGVEKVFLSYVVSDFRGGELRTGEVVIDIAETLAEPRF